MSTVSAAIVCVAFGLSALAEKPKASPDPILMTLKAKLEQEFQKLDPKPTFEFPDGYDGRSLVVRFKTRDYVVHPRNKAGRIAETTEKHEGPSDDGFLLRAHVQPVGVVNQSVVPQVVRETYWDLYLNVYPVRNTQKQVYFCLSYGGWTDETLIEKIQAVASYACSAVPRDQAGKQLSSAVHIEVVNADEHVEREDR
jgi:hypothetical protein